MSTTPKPPFAVGDESVVDCEHGNYNCTKCADAALLRGARAELDEARRSYSKAATERDAAQARVKELEGRIENLRASHEYPRLQDVGRIAELEARVKELEGGHLSPGLFAEYGRLDAAWQGLVADRDAATARAEKAEARVKELEQLNDELDEQRAEYHALATYNEGLVAAAASRANHHQQALTESRASEARMREALERLLAVYDKWRTQPARAMFDMEALRQILSTPVSDWLAARDRRTWERAAKAEDEAWREHLRRWAESIKRREDRALAHLATNLVTPLVEFKPEGA